jgi:putative transposase
MPEIGRLNSGSDAIEVSFVEREATPTELMELSIHLHLGGLSVSIIFLLPDTLSW